MSMIKGIHHVSLECRDAKEYEHTIAFYKDVLMLSEPPFPIRVAFCKGPLGEEIEFFQER